MDGTNIGAAVEKAEGSFNGKEDNKPNRTIVLLTDGIPNLHEQSIELYEGDENIEKYFKDVAQKTREDLIKIKQKGVDIITVIASEGLDADEEKIKKEIFNEFTCYDVDDSEIAQVFEKLKNESIKIKDVESIKTFDKNWSVGEDANRRNQVDKQYQRFRNAQIGENTTTTYSQMFTIIPQLKGMTADENIVQNILKKNYEEFTNQDVKPFTENNYMTVTSKEYEFRKYQLTEDDDNYYVNGTAYPKENYEVTVTEENYVQQNLVLVERERVLNTIEKKITGLKLTLQDGTVLYDFISDNAKKTRECMNNKTKAQIEDISNFPGIMLLQTDKDIIHGATLQIEYTLVFKNASEGVNTTEFTILDYYDKSFQYNPNMALLSENGRNSDYQWKIVTGKELKDNQYIATTNQTIEDDTEYLVAEYNEKSNTPVTTPVGSNGERYIKLALSQTLTPEMIQKDYETFNQAEIVSYSNTKNRRSNYYEYMAHLSSYIKDASEGKTSQRSTYMSSLNSYLSDKQTTLKTNTISTTRDLIYAVYKNLSNDYDNFIKNHYSQLVVCDLPGNYEIDSLHRDELDSTYSISTVITPPTGEK